MVGFVPNEMEEQQAVWLKLGIRPLRAEVVEMLKRIQPGSLPTRRRSDPGIRGAQPEPNSQNVPLHSSALARWQSVSGREQPVPNVKLHSESLPNGTQLRCFLPALPRPTVHSPEAVDFDRGVNGENGVV